MKNSFSRYNFLKKKLQRIAVDFDALLVIVSHNSPQINELFVNTILSGLEGFAEIIFVFTKSDLPFSDNDNDIIDDLKSAGFKVMMTSVRTMQGVEELKSELKDKRALLVGESAGGKSSLINAMLGEEVQATGDVSKKNNKGCHTTTSSRVLEGDCFTLIDTPGVRYVIPDSTQIVDINTVFPEFSRYECKFKDCKHIKETSCMVKKAVEDGGISKRRYSSYLKLLELIDKHRT